MLCLRNKKKKIMIMHSYLEACIWCLYFSHLQANHYYKLFITWTSQKIKNTFVRRNMFEFKHIKPFDRSYIENPGPMVVFATPGMLHAGLSLQIFRKWASNDNNMVRFLCFELVQPLTSFLLRKAKVWCCYEESLFSVFSCSHSL